MPAKVYCRKCERHYMASDKLAGKQAACPKCGLVLQVPAAPGRVDAAQPGLQNETFRSRVIPETGPAGNRREPPPPPPPVEQWYVLTPDGEQHGPMTKSQLDGWVVQGRLNDQCQVLREGWDQWKWASEVYPSVERRQDSPVTAVTQCPGCHRDVPVAESDLGEMVACPYSEDRGLQFRAARKTTSSRTVDDLVQAMVQALSLRKISFFVGGGILASIPVVALECLVALVAALARSWILFALGYLLTLVVAIGLNGVIIGGVAHMAYRESKHLRASVGDACSFCAQQFVRLFVGAVALVLIPVVCLVIVNLIVFRVAVEGSAGAFVVSVLLVPLTLFNAAVLLILLTGVLVPCAMAVEHLGPWKALQRLSTCLTHRTSSILVQFTLAFSLALLIFVTLAVLFWCAALPASSAAFVSQLSAFVEQFQMMDRGPETPPWGPDSGLGKDESPFGGSSRGPTGPQWSFEHLKGLGDLVGLISLVLLLLGVFSVPTVFYTCAMTRYYDAIAPDLAKARLSAPERLTGRIDVRYR